MGKDLLQQFENKYNIKVESAGGGKYRCCCPMSNHKDSDPSFFIFDHDWSVHCYGCGYHGFLRDLLGEASDLKARLQQLGKEKEVNIELIFALECLATNDKGSIIPLMQRFDDAQDQQQKKQVMETLQNKNFQACGETAE